MKVKKITKGYFNDNPPPPPAPPVVPPPPTPPDARFTQADIDRIVGERTAKEREKSKSYLADLENLRNTANLTMKEKEDLQLRIDTLSKDVFSKEELAKQEQEKLSKKFKAEQETLVAERDGYKKKHDGLVIKTALVEASVANKAFNSQQILQLFQNSAKIVPVLDSEGKDTGLIDVKIPVQAKKGDKVVELELSATEALKTMRENPEIYGNLFLYEGKGGAGFQPGPTGSGGGTGGGFNHQTGSDDQFFQQRERERAARK